MLRSDDPRIPSTVMWTCPSLRLSNHDISDNGVLQSPTQTEASPLAVNAASIIVMATKKNGCGVESLR